MAIIKRAEARAYLTPLVGFLLLFLGFPAVINLIYSVSTVDFQTLRSPTLSGFGNYVSVLADRDFWRATSFSLRFGILTAMIECLLGLFLAIFLAPLLSKRSALMAPLMDCVAEQGGGITVAKCRVLEASPSVFSVSRPRLWNRGSGRRLIEAPSIYRSGDSRARRPSPKQQPIATRSLDAGGARPRLPDPFL